MNEIVTDSVGAVGIGVITASNLVPNTVFYSAGNVEVFKIGSDGRLFWRGREVETDDDLRAAMREVNQLMCAMVHWRP